MKWNNMEYFNFKLILLQSKYYAKSKANSYNIIQYIRWGVDDVYRCIIYVTISISIYK